MHQLDDNARPSRRRPKGRCSKSRLRPRGLALLETLIAAGVVLTMLSVATPLVIRSARIWKQTRHHQFAADELSGQMDRLIAMSASDRIAALDELSVSPEVREVLDDASLKGRWIADQDGKRIELSIDWRGTGDPAPVTLVAWVDPMPQSTSQPVPQPGGDADAATTRDDTSGDAQ